VVLFQTIVYPTHQVVDLQSNVKQHAVKLLLLQTTVDISVNQAQLDKLLTQIKLNQYFQQVVQLKLDLMSMLIS